MTQAITMYRLMDIGEHKRDSIVPEMVFKGLRAIASTGEPVLAQIPSQSQSEEAEPRLLSGAAKGGPSRQSEHTFSHPSSDHRLPSSKRARISPSDPSEINISSESNPADLIPQSLIAQCLAIDCCSRGDYRTALHLLTEARSGAILATELHVTELRGFFHLSISTQARLVENGSEPVASFIKTLLSIDEVAGTAAFDGNARLINSALCACSADEQVVSFLESVVVRRNFLHWLPTTDCFDQQDVEEAWLMRRFKALVDLEGFTSAHAQDCAIRLGNSLSNGGIEKSVEARNLFNQLIEFNRTREHLDRDQIQLLKLGLYKALTAEGLSEHDSVIALCLEMVSFHGFAPQITPSAEPWAQRLLLEFRRTSDDESIEQLCDFMTAAWKILDRPGLVDLWSTSMFELLSSSHNQDAIVKLSQFCREMVDYYSQHDQSVQFLPVLDKWGCRFIQGPQALDKSVFESFCFQILSYLSKNEDLTSQWPSRLRPNQAKADSHAVDPTEKLSIFARTAPGPPLSPILDWTKDHIGICRERDMIHDIEAALIHSGYDETLLRESRTLEPHMLIHIVSKPTFIGLPLGRILGSASEIILDL